FRVAVKAADKLVEDGGTILVLSAKYGLIELDRNIVPYNLKLGQPGAITVDELRRQLRPYRGATIIALLPKPYDALLAAAFRTDRYHNPLRGSRGSGDHCTRCASIARDSWSAIASDRRLFEWRLVRPHQDEPRQERRWKKRAR